MSENTSSGGIGIVGVIFLILLVLKLAEVGTVAHWSWWAVTAPLWGPLCVGLTLGIIALAITSIADWRAARRALRHETDR